MVAANPGAVNDIRELTDSIMAPPKYDSSDRNKRKVTEELIAAIKVHLDENEQKRHNG